MNPSSPKTHWSVLKGFLINKKILCTPPLCHYKFIIDFKAKSELFNSFFSKLCSVIGNGTKLPSDLVYLTNDKLPVVRVATPLKIPKIS